jgi:hypothetical protein
METPSTSTYVYSTFYMSILIVVERDTPCTSILPGGGKRYTLHVHTAGGGKRYTLHVHTAGGGMGYTLHVYTVSDGKGYTCRSMLVVERDTPCTSLQVVEREGNNLVWSKPFLQYRQGPVFQLDWFHS